MYRKTFTWMNERNKNTQAEGPPEDRVHIKKENSHGNTHHHLRPFDRTESDSGALGLRQPREDKQLRVAAASEPHRFKHLLIQSSNRDTILALRTRIESTGQEEAEYVLSCSYPGRCI